MANFLNALKNETNYTYTENGALAHKTTNSALYDMFALGGAYRQRPDTDIILLFKNAFEENPKYALKCLFYLRDVRGGVGERRFFRVAMKWLANANPDAARRNLKYVCEFGRYDDLYLFVGTKVEKDAFELIKQQLVLDMTCKTPSLLAKWLKSENASSPETKKLAKLTRTYLEMNSKQYRKILSSLRQKINVLERLMSAGEWDKIEFDKIPSRAGLIYKNAFARHDVERAQAAARTYADFISDENTKVNAKDLFPYEVVNEAIKYCYKHSTFWNSPLQSSFNDIDRLAINKYWDNLADYFNSVSFNGLAVVDTSASMVDTRASAPINVAISLGMYCAERAKGPFAGHYISFSRAPRLVKVEGVDFVDKVARIYKTNLCENTNLEATFELLLDTALMNHMRQEDLPEKIIIISDMEIDFARTKSVYTNNNKVTTVMENIRAKWNSYGYEMPKLIYWNVESRNNIILDNGPDVSYVSGLSASIFEQVMKNKTGYDLMMDKLDSERYSVIE